jgi:hypothetical protein
LSDAIGRTACDCDACDDCGIDDDESSSRLKGVFFVWGEFD